MANGGENKVFCPYCGAKMANCSDNDKEAPWYWYQCVNTECRSVSPKRKTEAEAYKAAMKRYEEPNRILLVDNISSKECFLEWHECALDVEECLVAVEDVIDKEWKREKKIKIYTRYGDVLEYSMDRYNRTFRCWLKNPTFDEKQAAKWLPEKKQEDDDNE